MRFGDFIKEKRLDMDLTMKDVAEKLDISVSYLSDIEKGRRNPFEIDKLKSIALILSLSKEDTTQLMNLAGNERDEVAPDIVDYVKEKKYVTNALRTIKDIDPSEEEWLRFIEESIKNREDKGE